MSSPSARALSLAAVMLVGCSGAAGSDLFAAAETANSPTDPGPSATGTTPGPSPAPPPPDPAPLVPDAGQADADPPTTTCTPEAEPNNDLAHATPFAGSFCGKIGSANDVDFGSFVVPANAKSIVISHTENGGKVNYRYYLNGRLLAASDPIDAVPGATYAVQIKPGNGGSDSPSYKLDVVFK